jgi:hypothetical protein
MYKNYSSMFLSEINKKKEEFFFLLDPQNFGDSPNVSEVIEACDKADCFHPCYGASHESFCY